MWLTGHWETYLGGCETLSNIFYIYICKEVDVEPCCSPGRCWKQHSALSAHRMSLINEFRTMLYFKKQPVYR